MEHLGKVKDFMEKPEPTKENYKKRRKYLFNCNGGLLRFMMPLPMKVHLTTTGKIIDLDGPKTVQQLLKTLQLIPEAYLVIRDDTLLTEDEHLRPSDSIEIRSVISGG